MLFYSKIRFVVFSHNIQRLFVLVFVTGHSELHVRDDEVRIILVGGIQASSNFPSMILVLF